MAICYIIGIIGGLYLKRNIILFLSFILCVYLTYTYIHYKYIKYKNIKTIDSENLESINRLKKESSKLKYKAFIVIIIIVSCNITVNKRITFDEIYYDNSKISIVGKVEQVIESQYGNKVVIKTIKVNRMNNSKYIGKEMLIENRESITSNLNLGDIILIDGVLDNAQKQKNYRCFDYRKYLMSKDICAVINVESLKKISNKKIPFYKQIMININNRIKKKFFKHLSENIANFCTALILGDKANLSTDIIDSFSESSLSHILAISGLHVMYVANFITTITKKFGKRASYILSILGVIFFYNLVQNTSSVLRATIMLVIFYLSKILFRKSDSLTNISISAIFILVMNPFNIYSSSFLLSFMATVGIILFYEYFNKIFKIKRNLKILKYLKEQISLGISANITTLPIIATIYNKFSIIFIVSNPISSFLVSIIIPLIFIFLICTIISSNLANLIGMLLTFFINLLLNFSKFCYKLRFFNFKIGSIKIMNIVCYYIVIFFMYIKIKAIKKDKKIINKILKFIIIVNIIISTVSYFIIRINKGIEVYFIDVGQGESTLIITKNNKNILIDGGGNESLYKNTGNNEEDYIGKNILYPYLINRGVKSLDYMIISHFDSDHCGGLFYIMQNMKIKNIIIGKQFEQSENYEKFKKIAKSTNVNIRIFQSGDRINIDNIFFETLWPDENSVISENNINNNSLVLKMMYGKFSILFTGDIENMAEQRIISKYKNNALNSTILKVPHHGSKTSSSEMFLKKVNPKYAIIGVGINNKFGHPSQSVIETLNKMNVEIYRTDLMGEIIIKSDGKKIEFESIDK